MKTKTLKALIGSLFLGIVAITTLSFTTIKDDQPEKENNVYKIRYNTIEVSGLDIFYRESGDRDKPTIVLLHGYPTSSYMFRNLITDLSVRYHVIAPDYPGFGKSEHHFNEGL